MAPCLFKRPSLAVSRNESYNSTTSTTSCKTTSAALGSERGGGGIEGGGGGNGNPDSSSSGSEPERTMGLMSAILMIIGTLIGTGIFASPGPLFDSVHCTQTSFIIWAFAGLVCTIGAFAYAELGTMFPASGGDFQYLARAYGKKVALVFGWTFITILNPIGTAGIAGVLGRYAVDVITYLQTGTSAGIGGAAAAAPATPAVIAEAARAALAGVDDPADIAMAAIGAVLGNSVLNGTSYLPPHAHSPYAPGTPAYSASAATSAPVKSIHEGGMDSSWTIRLFSIAAILLMGCINIFFREGGKYASNILAIFKIAGMLMLIVIGSIQAAKTHAQSEALLIPIAESSHNILDYVSALCFAFFAYNGFNNINLGLGELRDPEKNLKRAVWIAMPFVTVLFLLANFAFFAILSSHDLRHVHSLSLHAGHTVLGLPGGFLMAFTVIASALGSINANLWAGSRLLVIMAQDNAVIPFPIGKAWTRRGTQARALLILMIQASIHALINLDFKTFSKIYSAVGWSWYGLSIFGLLYMRKSRPNFPRPVKVFWPLAVMFVLVAFFLVIGALTLAFMGSGAPGAVGAGAGNGSAVSSVGKSGTVPTRDDAAMAAAGRSTAKDGSEWTSVIMFGSVIIFMLGVIPAFYLTRWYNRVHTSQESSASGNSEGSDELGDSDVDHDELAELYDCCTCDCNDTFEEEAGGYMYVARGTKGANRCRLTRRDSSASSVTLVDETKAKKKKKEKEKRRLRQEQEQSRQNRGLGLQQPSAAISVVQLAPLSSTGPSLLLRTESMSMDGSNFDQEIEEEMARIQSLRVARGQHRRNSLDTAELGDCSMEQSRSSSPLPSSPPPRRRHCLQHCRQLQAQEKNAQIEKSADTKIEDENQDHEATYGKIDKGDDTGTGVGGGGRLNIVIQRRGSEFMPTGLGSMSASSVMTSSKPSNFGGTAIMNCMSPLSAATTMYVPPWGSAAGSLANSPTTATTLTIPRRFLPVASSSSSSSSSPALSQLSNFASSTPAKAEVLSQQQIYLNQSTPMESLSMNASGSTILGGVGANSLSCTPSLSSTSTSSSPSPTPSGFLSARDMQSILQTRLGKTKKTPLRWETVLEPETNDEEDSRAYSVESIGNQVLSNEITIVSRDIEDGIGQGLTGEGGDGNRGVGGESSRSRTPPLIRLFQQQPSPSRQ